MKVCHFPFPVILFVYQAFTVKSVTERLLVKDGSRYIKVPKRISSGRQSLMQNKIASQMGIIFIPSLIGNWFSMSPIEDGASVLRIKQIQ